jgi:hypothetical protein
MLYQYKGTNTDAEAGTNVHILTLKLRAGRLQVQPRALAYDWRIHRFQIPLKASYTWQLKASYTGSLRPHIHIRRF